MGVASYSLEPEAMTEAQVKMFVDAGVPIQISENVVGTQWAKLIINCAITRCRLP